MGAVKRERRNRITENSDGCFDEIFDSMSLSRCMRISAKILQVQELIKGVNDADIYPSKSDAVVIATQIRQLTEEMRELSLPDPIAVLNGNPTSTGSYASYLVPAAALEALRYCYRWWKRWSLSDIVT